MPHNVNYQINSLNDLKIACKSGEWSYMPLYWVDTIAKGYRIDTITNWQSNTFIWLLAGKGHVGPWYYLKGERYIAFRTGVPGQYHYGWLKVEMNYDHNMIFKGYAVEK